MQISQQVALLQFDNMRHEGAEQTSDLIHLVQESFQFTVIIQSAGRRGRFDEQIATGG